jgi:glycosyltransferase involved in cell wall biosynthesis
MTRDVLKIVYTINRMDVGGSQTHLLQVFRLLDRRRFDPVLYCLSGEGALLDAVRETGVRVVAAGVRSGFRSPRVIPGVLRLARMFKRESADIVHNYLLRANAVGSVAARLAGVPIVLASKRGCHEMRGWELRGAQLGNALSDCVTTNAEAVREFVHHDESCALDKMVVIPSGIDTDRFQPRAGDGARKSLGLRPDDPVVGVVTRMRVRKGVEEFLEAMIRVRIEHPGAQAVIVGEVELDDDLRARVAAAGMTDDLHLLGRRSDMPEVLSSFDLFVLASHDEGMSNAILEAMAMEKPVVATDVGGTGEVVREGLSGRLVPPKVVDPLARAITEVLSDRVRMQEMGRAGRAIVVEEFSARSMVRQMEALYERLVREHSDVRASATSAEAIGR